MHKRSTVFVILSVTVSACGESPAPAADASTDAGVARDGARSSDAASDAGAVMIDAGELDPLFVEYAADPDRHPNLPNCSYAGYHRGEDPLPTGEGLPVIDVAAHGAVPDDGEEDGDDTDAIEAAIAEAAATGGVVQFAAGTYHVSRPLMIRSDRTILRGAGRDSTVLQFTRPLEDFYDLRLDSNDPSSGTQWSWLGGLVWLEPNGRDQNPNTNVNLDDEGNVQPGYRVLEFWPTRGPRVELGSAQRGDRSVSFSGDAPSWMTPGTMAVIRVQDMATEDRRLLVHLSGDNAWAEAFSALGENERIRDAPIDVPIEIERVEAGVVHFRQPLRFDLRPEWQPQMNALRRAIRESGVEHLTIRMGRTYSWSHGEVHHHEDGWNGIYLNTAIDCFVRDVRIVNSDNGVGVATSKHVTIEDVRIDYDDPNLRAQHHGLTCRGGAHDNLFRGIEIESRVFHGINVEAYSMGNVWTESRLVRGSFDSHRRLPLENCRTDLTLVSAGGQAGGERNTGPLSGARTVHWNVRVEGPVEYTDLFRGELIADPQRLPMGALVGVRGIEVPFVDLMGASTDIDFAALPESGCRISGSGVDPGPPNPPNLWRAQLALRLANER